MSAPSFISAKLSFKGKAAVSSIAVSVTVVIVAIAVAGGFRREISAGLRTLSGDIQISQYSRGELPSPIKLDAALAGQILAVEGVGAMEPVVYATGIVRSDDVIHGVVFKGVEMPLDTSEQASLDVRIPRRLSCLTGLGTGDGMLTYFIGENVVPRKFIISDIYDSIVTDDDKLVVFCDIKTLRRVVGWDSDQCSVFEVKMSDPYPDETSTRLAEAEISALLFEHSGEDSLPLYCERTMDKYQQLFDWLRLIDYNVTFILVLMVIVAAINMISGLLILLFEHMSTIGLLKALGMADAQIARTFLLVSARLVGWGMVIGNLIGIGLCLIEKYTHLLSLDPVNYFVSYVPIFLDKPKIVLYELISFVAIMLVLLIPCKFISRVDPARTIKEN